MSKQSSRRKKQLDQDLNRVTLLALLETFIVSVISMQSVQDQGDDATKAMIGRACWLLEQELARVSDILTRFNGPQDVEDFLQRTAGQISFPGPTAAPAALEPSAPAEAAHV